MTSSLEAIDLSKRFGRRTWALRGLDLSIPQGCMVGLVGPNGAGKSTLLKTWVGFEKPTSGRVLTLGLDPWRDRRTVLPRVAYLAQSPVFYKDLTVRDHLDYVSHYRGSGFDKRGALQRLSELRVPAESKANALSGGQAAQLGLAIAFAMRAEVILLDEPLAALDPLARREFIDVLTAETTQSGATAVLSSHIVSDIERACNRLIVLSAGAVQIEGVVSELVADHTVAPSHDAVNRQDLVSELSDGRGLFRRRPPFHGPGRPPTLEDLVLGYLTAGRSTQ